MVALREKQSVVLFCSLIWFTHSYVSNSFSVLLPLITSEFSLSYAEAGALATASILVFALMQFPTGYLAGRIGSKKIVVFGVAFHSVFNIFLAYSTSYVHFFLFNMLRSVGSGCHLTVATAFISNHFDERDRGKAIGIHESVISLAGLVAPVVTLPLALLFDWRITYVVYGIVGLAITAASWIFLPGAEGFEKSATSVQETEIRFFSTKVLLLLVVMTLQGFVFHAVNAFLPLYLSKDKEILLVYLGYYVAIPNLLGLIGRPLGGYLSDKIGRIIMALVSFASVASGIILTVFVREFYWLVLSLALLGFGLNTVVPVLFAFLMDLFSPSKRALITGRINTIRHLIAGFSPSIMGAIADSAGFSISFLTLALVVVANMLVTIKMGQAARAVNREQ